MLAPMTASEKHPVCPPIGDRPCDKERPDFPRPLRWRNIRWAVAAMVLGVAMVPFTESIQTANLWVLNTLPLQQFIYSVKQWPTLWPILFVVVAVWTLDRARRYTIPAMLLALLAAGAVNGVIKIAVGRARPEYGLQMTSRERDWIREYTQAYPESHLQDEPSDQWLLFSPQRPLFNARFWSFPSGHSNTALALTAYLTALYPQARCVWLVIGGGAAFSRTHNRRHYLEETLFGGGLGWLIAQVVFAWRWPVRLGRWGQNRIDALRGRLIPARIALFFRSGIARLWRMYFPQHRP